MTESEKRQQWIAPDGSLTDAVQDLPRVPGDHGTSLENQGGELAWTGDELRGIVGVMEKAVDDCVVLVIHFGGKDDAYIDWRQGIRDTPEMAAARQEAEDRALYEKLKVRFEPEAT